MPLLVAQCVEMAVVVGFAPSKVLLLLAQYVKNVSVMEEIGCMSSKSLVLVAQCAEEISVIVVGSSFSEVSLLEAQWVEIDAVIYVG